MLEAKRRRAPVIPEKTESKKQNPKKKKKTVASENRKEKWKHKKQNTGKANSPIPKGKEKDASSLLPQVNSEQNDNLI